MKKLSIEFVRSWIEGNTRYKLITEEYVGNSSNLHVKDEEGYSYYISYNNLRRGRKPRKFIIYNPYTIDNIKNWIKINGYNVELLSDKYVSNGSKNPEDKLNFVCSEGHHFNKTWVSFRKHPSCNVCNPRSTLKTHDMFLKEVKALRGDEYDVMGRYVNAKTKITMKHEKCGTTWDVLPSVFLHGVGCPNSKCCRLHGEKNPRWNPVLTDEDRTSNRDTLENIKWRKAIFEKYNYECQICFRDTGRSVAHHLDGYNWAKDKRFDIDNGVCLCEEHHKQFHDFYGYGNNTKEQYIEYRNNHLKEA